MKKTLIVLLALVVVAGGAVIVVKNRAVPDVVTNSLPTALGQNDEETAVEETQSLPVYEDGSIELDPGQNSSDNEDGPDFQRHYRLIYYRLPSPIDNLAGQEGWDFLDEISREYNGKELSEMLLVSYIKRFKIPKETVEKAINERREYFLSIGNDIDYEEYELPNVDIIYTFDNDIINEYYRRA